MNKINVRLTEEELEIIISSLESKIYNKRTSFEERRTICSIADNFREKANAIKLKEKEDNDIIKAIKTCCSDKGCNECPYNDSIHCGKLLREEVLGLLVEQKEMIDKLLEEKEHGKRIFRIKRFF